VAEPALPVLPATFLSRVLSCTRRTMVSMILAPGIEPTRTLHRDDTTRRLLLLLLLLHYYYCDYHRSADLPPSRSVILRPMYAVCADADSKSRCEKSERTTPLDSDTIMEHSDIYDTTISDWYSRYADCAYQSCAMPPSEHRGYWPSRLMVTW